MRRFPEPTTAASANAKTSLRSGFGRRLWRGALTAVACGGALLALWPVGQTAWARWHQAQLEREWQRAAQTVALAPSNEAATALSSTRTDVQKTKPTQKPAEKWPPTRLVVPEIGLDAIVLPGDDEADLRDGPGHDPLSSLPGQPGNCVIAGHRNVYGSYFYRLDELLPGSKILLRTPRQKFVYTVVQTTQVADTQGETVRAVSSAAPPMLTLYTCTLPRSTNRLVVTAQLVEENK